MNKINHLCFSIPRGVKRKRRFYTAAYEHAKKITVIASWEKKHTENSGTQQHLYFKMADSRQAHGSVYTWRKRHFRYIPQSPYKMHRLSNPELLRPLEIVDWLNFMQVREAKYIKLAAYVLYMFSSKTKGRASAYGHNRLEQQHRL